MLHMHSNTISAAPFDENDRPTITLPPPTSTKGHQRSRTTADLPPLFARTTSSSPTRFSNFLPSLRSTSRTASPERVAVSEAAEFDIESARSSTHKHKPSASVAKLASWFEGSSDPVNISLVPSPRKENQNPFDENEKSTNMFSASSENVDTLTKRPSRPQTSSSTNPSRFSFFRKPSQVELNHTEDRNELVQINIRDALFPSGPPEEFSPAAFKNLQLNAEGTLRRFQNAHSDQQRIIRSITSAKNIQADDLEAAQTRNEHLKLQLGEMAERAAEQERLIAALRAEVAASKQPYGNTGVHQSSIRKVSQNTAPQYRRNRSSDVSTWSESEISDAVSVFSEPISAMESPGTSVAASPVLKHAVMHQPRIQQSFGQHTAVIPVAECQKCYGVRPNEAWDVITIMKVESQALKERIAELEGAHDNALDFLNGLKI